MTFFYDLNKRLADLAKKQDAAQLAESKQAEAVAQSPLAQALNESDYSAKKARAGKDIGKPGKAFAKIAKSAGERYGSKAAGERVAGAVLNKLRHPKEGIENEGNAFTGALAKTPKGGKFKVGGKEFTDTSSLEEGTCSGCNCSPCKCDSVDESALQAYLGDKKYGKKGMDALRKAGREHAGKEKMAKIRAQYDKMDEADMEEGNAFTGVLAKTPKGGKFKVGNKEFTDTSDLEEGYAEMDAWLKQREKEKGTGKFDVKDTGYSKRYTRREEPEADDEEASTEPKRRGRPAGPKKGPERTTKGAWKHKGERKVKEGSNCCPHCGESLEVSEVAPPGAKAERMVKHIKKSLSKDGKLSDKDKAIAYATTWKAHNKGKVEEESTEKEDQKAEKAGKKVAKDIEHDEGHKAKGDNKAEKAGKKVTKDIEYDDKKDKEEKVDETTVAGSVATSTAAPKSSKGMQFGKGVYESLDQQFRQALTESISVEESVEECGMEGAGPSVVIKASGEEAAKLMALLKLAGLAQDQSLEENQPDWPTNTETSKDAFQYSGGLNKPKSTGQTTTPVISSQFGRQVSMEESVKLEKTLSDLYKNYKG